MGGGGLQLLAEVEREEGADGSYAELRGDQRGRKQCQVRGDSRHGCAWSFSRRACLRSLVFSFLCSLPPILAPACFISTDFPLCVSDVSTPKQPRSPDRTPFPAEFPFYAVYNTLVEVFKGCLCPPRQDTATPSGLPTRFAPSRPARRAGCTTSCVGSTSTSPGKTNSASSSSAWIM